MLPSFSFGADWGLIGESGNLKYYYDLDSVKKTNNYQFEFWQKQVGKIETQITRAKVNCINDSYTILDIYKYQDGKVISSIVNQEHTLIPPPETAAYLTIERVCNFGMAMEFGKFNIPSKQDFSDEIDYELARFHALGFEDYVPSDEMMNEYFNLWENSQAERFIYKRIINVLSGVNRIKIKYLNLKIN